MPLKPFQQNYWMNTDTRVAPVRTSRGGYPGWQITVIGSLWGAVWDYLLTALEKISWSWRLIRRVRRMPRLTQAVVFLVLDSIESRNFEPAQVAVKQTARTLGFNNPEAWKALSHAMKADAGSAENTFRRLNASHLLREATHTQEPQPTNPEINLLIELAYHRYALKGRQRGDV